MRAIEEVYSVSYRPVSTGRPTPGRPACTDAYSFPLATIFANREVTIAIKAKVQNTIKRTN